MEGYFIYIATCLIIGAVSAYIAKMKEKDPVLWFIVGAILNVFALAIIANVPAVRKRVGS